MSAVAHAAEKPALPAGGIELTPGQIPTTCTLGTQFDAYGSNYGYYFSEKANQWVSAPWCYPRWGNLEASASAVVEAGAEFVVTAIPNEGSNSAMYAPETKSIQWVYPGQRISGCGNTDLQCRVILTKTATTEWQWFEFKVSMPRTFFVDSPGSNCAGQHLCPGVTTNAWAFGGVAPAGAKATTPPLSPGGCASTGSSSAHLWPAAMVALFISLGRNRVRRTYAEALRRLARCANP